MPSAHPAEIKEIALAAYEDGMSCRNVTAVTGVHWSTVREWAAAAGVLRTPEEVSYVPRDSFGPCFRGPEGYVVRTLGRDYWLYPHARSGNGSRTMLEHRRVMAEHLGRPLEPSETIHHLNGDKTDNRIENLELHGGSHGSGQRFVCANCGCSDRKAVPLGP